MTVFPFQIRGISDLYNRILKIRPSMPEPVGGEPGDIVTISAEAKKQRILEEAKTEVLEQIRKTE